MRLLGGLVKPLQSKIWKDPESSGKASAAFPEHVLAVAEL